ncbi:glycosyltransferase [Agrobacterium sp. AGB01]|uniref:glycosyltransferase n=1 Tax=Agrobacterium sp. AGB01 TaxID=2769302 RepID=UPI00177D0AA5|nr:glycosyltransferase [Agrobacterium sp. AGB01]MBD9388216.1 glycosyltransferase [Agrobacterium sp. AGB01]
MVRSGRSGRSARVLYYLERYLPASQAFVAQQSKALSRYEPAFLAGKTVASPSREIFEAEVHAINASMKMRSAELALKLFRFPLVGAFPSIPQSDLLHAHFGKNGYVLWPLADAAQKPLITTFHGFDATYNGDPKTPGGFNQVRFFSKGRSQMAKGNLWNVAVSDFVRDRMLSLGFPPERVFRHYVGVDTSLFSMRPRRRRKGLVVSIARFVEYKGHRFMIDALSRVAAQGIPVEFVMIGDGPIRKEIEMLARKTLPKVTILEKLTQPEIRDLLAEAEIYLHGSVTLDNGHAEAFGLANLEAEAVGTPVVAFQSGGVGEAVEDGKTGMLLSERDVVGMANAIGALLTDSNQWTSFSRRGPEMVREHFDITSQTSKLEDYYDEVISEHRNKRPV